MLTIPATSISDEFGFRRGTGSVHTSRTMMLAELTQALDRVPADAPMPIYTSEIVDENLLGKPTRFNPSSNCEAPHRALCAQSALSNLPRLPILLVRREARDGRCWRSFWLARDRLLWEYSPQVLPIPHDQVVTSTEIETWLEEKYPGRFHPTTRLSTAQNLASTWSQVGILRGTIVKRRSQPIVTPVVTAYALLLGYLGGLRSGRLLDSSWTSLLDRPHSAIIDSAIEASKQGWLRYKMAGSVIEVTFPGLLTSHEERACREQD